MYESVCVGKGVEGQMIMDVSFKESDRPIGIIVQKISSSNS